MEKTKPHWSAVVKRQRNLSGSVWLFLACGHQVIRRGEKANEQPERVRCKVCEEQESKEK